MKQLLKELTETIGPSGNEDQIRKLVLKHIKAIADEVRVDQMGNVIARKRGPGEKLMLAAHMDEIGVIITYIEDDGFLRFSNVGGISPFQLLGQRVRFANSTIGVFGMEDLKDIKKLKLENMYIDIGASNKKEAQDRVAIGDMGVFHQECIFVGEHVISKAVDDRVGCAILIKVLESLENPKYDTSFVFTVQEEVGLRGARTSAHGVNPDLAIAVDVTLTGDTPEAKKMAVDLGKGPAIKVKDRSIICHPRIKEGLVSTAEKMGIDYQLEILDFGGTDAGAIHLSRSGVPSGVLSIPTRYVHSASEMANMKDIKNCIGLLKGFIEQ